MGLALIFISGCTSQKNAKPLVVVQCGSITEDFQRAIELQCPDIDIKWYLSTKVHHSLYDNYDDVPDIYSISTYYIGNTHTSYLKDISDKININNYSRNIIDNFTNAKGEVYWLPVLGTGICIIANKTLFQKYGLEYPTDFESLKAVDRKFKQHGIDGISWGMGGEWDYETMQTAQVLCADLFTSYEGMKWRKEYTEQLESGGSYTIDDQMWPKVFERFKEAIDCGLIDNHDMTTGTYSASNDFSNGKSAMILSNTNNIKWTGVECEVLPAFDASGNAWVPLTLNQVYGVSTNVSIDRLPYVMKVLDAIGSSKSLQAYNESRGGMLPINNNTSILSEDMKYLEEPIHNGYTYLMFNEIGGGLMNGVRDAVRSIFFKKTSVSDAVEYCKERVLARRSEETFEDLNSDPSQLAFTTKAYYPLVTDSDHISPANSSLANTTYASVNALSERKFDILMLEGNTAGCPIRPGDYYYDKHGKLGFNCNANFLFNSARPMYPAKMTVADLIQYLNTQFYDFNRIDDGLPLMAGASYVIDRYENGIAADNLPFKPNSANSGKISNIDNFPVRYVCTGIMKDGALLPLEKEIDVLVSRVCAFYMTDYLANLSHAFAGLEPAFGVYNEQGDFLYTPIDFTVDWLHKGNEFCEPTKYVSINEKQ